MGAPIADPNDVAVYLQLGTLSADQTARAELLVQLAQDLCETIITPLPVTALGVVLDVVARAFTNPTNAQTEGAGPFNVTYGAVAGGLWLTKQNKATLRRLIGSGGAFTIDPMPSDAASTLPWWDIQGTSTVQTS